MQSLMPDLKTTPHPQAQKILERGPLIFDTETTGFTTTDQIVELSIVGADHAPVIDTLLWTSQPMQPDAQKVHKISPREVRTAPKLATILNQLQELMLAHPVGAWNLPFDKRMLQQTLARNRLDYRWLGKVEFFDVMQLYGKCKLEVAVANTQIVKPEGVAHRALYDARCTLKILEYLAQPD